MHTRKSPSTQGDSPAFMAFFLISASIFIQKNTTEIPSLFEEVSKE